MHQRYDRLSPRFFPARLPMAPDWIVDGVTERLATQSYDALCGVGSEPRTECPHAMVKQSLSWALLVEVYCPYKLYHTTGLDICAVILN